MYIGIDVGGTNITGGLFSVEHEILKRAKMKSRAKDGTAAIMEQLFKVISELKGQSSEEILGIGIGIAGIIDSKAGIVRSSANIDVVNFPLKEVVEAEFHIPTYIENDVNVGVIGEWKYGGAKGYSNIVGIFVGTGIGGGLVLEGKLYTGKIGAAGEIGHIPIDMNGPYCGCGSKGCIEAYASKTGMEQYINALIKHQHKSSFLTRVEENNGRLKSGYLVEAIRVKDTYAIEVLDYAMEKLGVGIAGVINLLNPDLVVLGGGVMEALGDYLLPKIQASCEKYSMPELYKSTQFKMATLGDDSGIYGAMNIASQR
ncbi:MAG: ROK family protein [Fusobacteria bacterium]|nr:ROK family protein [Fusobacteriota bacterium]